MGRHDEEVEVMGVLEAETPKAYLLDTGDDKHWLPKSQVTLVSGDPAKGKGEELVVSIPEWLAREKGLD